MTIRKRTRVRPSRRPIEAWEAKRAPQIEPRQLRVALGLTAEHAAKIVGSRESIVRGYEEKGAAYDPIYSDEALRKYVNWASHELERGNLNARLKGVRLGFGLSVIGASFVLRCSAAEIDRVDKQTSTSEVGAAALKRYLGWAQSMLVKTPPPTRLRGEASATPPTVKPLFDPSAYLEALELLKGKS